MNWVDVSLPFLIGFFMVASPEMYVKSKPGDVPEEVERRRSVYGLIGFVILLTGAIMAIRKLTTTS